MVMQRKPEAKAKLSGENECTASVVLVLVLVPVLVLFEMCEMKGKSAVARGPMGWCGNGLSSLSA